MSSTVLIVVAVLVGVWYLGGAINSIISKSGRLAEREFEAFEREQAFRIAKNKEELKAKVEKFKSDSKVELSDEDLNKFLDI